MGAVGQAKGVLRCAAALALCSPAAATACSPHAPPDPTVPSWHAVHGFPLGSRPAAPAEIDRYLLRVDRASGRVRTFLAGRSARGRPIRVAAVGAPGDVARLERLAAGMRALRADRLRPARAAALVRSLPAFVWLGASIHGNEPSGADADMRLLRELAAGRSCADRGRLRRTVVFLLPDQNPDGRAAGTRANAAGFDLNRDWFAATQPETRAKLAALARFPPVVFADQHEEAGTGFFFPPNADPVHHEVPAHALRAIRRVLAPPLRRAFRARGADFVSGSAYDLFFMGYGDTVTTTLFGAAGMTFEKGGASPYRERTDEQHLAARTVVRTAARGRRALLEDWARSWRVARAQGAAGALQPNRVLQPGSEVWFPVPSRPVHGYVLHGGDAAALAARLAAAGVRVRRLPSGTPAVLRGFGERAAARTAVPAGAYVVPMAQPAKHWVQALLADDPHAPFPAFYDVGSWSNPLLMGVGGGALARRLRAATEPWRPPTPPVGATAHAFAGGAEASLALALALLRDGITVRRTPDGSYEADGDAGTIARAATRRSVSLEPRTAAPDGIPLRRPRVAVLEDTRHDGPGAWARWVLRERFALDPVEVSGAAIAGGALTGRDALVVADGATGPGMLDRPALTALRSWIAEGGTLVGWRGRGLAVAQAAGVTAVQERPAPSELVLAGNALRVALDPADPVAAGERPEGFVFNAGDPLLDARGAPVIARYPAGDRFSVSGYATGTRALRGTAAATGERVGAGRVVLFAFDPVFRGYAEGTQRLLGNALLAAAAPPAGPRARPARARPVSPGALAPASPHRDALLRVPLSDEPALAAAARAAGVEGRVERDLAAVTLRIPNAAGLPAEDRAWTRPLLAALRAAGVRPLLVLL